MLGDVMELCVVVKDIEAAIKRYETLFDLKVCYRMESKEFGYKAAILPLGKGHIELMQPTDPTKAVARFLERNGEGVYLVGFDTADIPGSAKKLQERGARVTFQPKAPVAWVHPADCHGLFVELVRPFDYDELSKR